MRAFRPPKVDGPAPQRPTRRARTSSIHADKRVLGDRLGRTIISYVGAARGRSAGCMCDGRRCRARRRYARCSNHHRRALYGYGGGSVVHMPRWLLGLQQMVSSPCAGSAPCLPGSTSRAALTLNWPEHRAPASMASCVSRRSGRRKLENGRRRHDAGMDVGSNAGGSRYGRRPPAFSTDQQPAVSAVPRIEVCRPIGGIALAGAAQGPYHSAPDRR